MSGCENKEEHKDYCDTCFTCHDCLGEAIEVDAVEFKKLKSRIADLDKKLDQAIDMLDTNARAYLLAEWSNP